MPERRFIDAKDEWRCRAIVTLKDKSTAQCGRRIVFTTAGLCTQHWRLIGSGKAVKRIPTPGETDA